jgi:membrane protein YqaA with SNARE-associated domain
LARARAGAPRPRGDPLIAYLALFGWSFAAATVLPLASEPMLVALVRRDDAFVVPVLVATAGNYLGACTTYYLARLAAARVGALRSARAGHAHAVRLLERFGQPALLLSWVPIVGDAIVAVAGAVGIRFAPFSAWVAAGKLARYSVVGWLATRV